MLPEIVAEALRFLSRRDLDKGCAVSKWFDALVAQCCDVYPLRPVAAVELYPSWKHLKAGIPIGQGTRSFSRMDDAVQFVGSILPNSCVRDLELGGYDLDIMKVSPDHLSLLFDSIRSGAVLRIGFMRVNFKAVDAGAFLAAVDSRGLQSLVVRRSVLPNGFVTDDLLRVSVAKGLLELRFTGNRSDAPLSVSDAAVLDYFFRADDAPVQHSLCLEVDVSGVTDMFLSKFFQRLRSGPVQPSGFLECHGAAEQRGLDVYAQY